MSSYHSEQITSADKTIPYPNAILSFVCYSSPAACPFTKGAAGTKYMQRRRLGETTGMVSSKLCGGNRASYNHPKDHKYLLNIRNFYSFPLFIWVSNMDTFGP